MLTKTETEKFLNHFYVSFTPNGDGFFIFYQKNGLSQDTKELIDFNSKNICEAIGFCAVTNLKLFYLGMNEKTDNDFEKTITFNAAIHKAGCSMPKDEEDFVLDLLSFKTDEIKNLKGWTNYKSY